MAVFALIHGGCHGGWCWERVVPLLEKQGHRVLAPDLPGAGADQTPLREVTLADRARFVADLIVKQAAPVILVGHSMGGTVISSVAERVPEHLAAVVYLAAFLLKNGESMWEAALRIPASKPELIMSEDGRTNRIAASSVPEFFYNTTPGSWLEHVLPKLREESVTVGATAVQVTPDRFGRVPRYYIETRRDRAIVPELQQRMREDWPCRGVYSLDTDHSPFYSAPEALAGHLLAIAGSLQESAGAEHA